MTTEDLNQIRAVVREEISAAESQLRTEIAAAVNTLREGIVAAEKRMIERQDRAAEALTINLSDVRTELSRRLDLLEKRIDLLSNAVFGLESHMAGVSRMLDALVKETSANNGTLEGYKRAFDALEARVRALEEKLGGQGPRPQ